MPLNRKATATWSGTGKEGTGHISSTSGALDGLPHTFKTRFENADGKAGTNPEELIAAALASCFTMKLSFVLNAAGSVPDLLTCVATVAMDKVGDGMGVVGIHLELEGRVPGLDETKFKALGEEAKRECPIGRLLRSVPITLDARLV